MLYDPKTRASIKIKKENNLGALFGAPDARETEFKMANDGDRADEGGGTMMYKSNSTNENNRISFLANQNNFGSNQMMASEPSTPDQFEDPEHGEKDEDEDSLDSDIEDVFLDALGEEQEASILLN